MKPKILLILVLFLTINTYAQKSAPVAGDAAQLIDLLKKDYNSVNPETKDEIISRDMHKVIAVFKTYMNENERDSLKYITCNETYSNLNTIASSYFIEAKKKGKKEKDKKKKNEAEAKAFCKIVDSLPLFYKSYDSMRQLIKRSFVDNIKVDNLIGAKKKYYKAKFFADVSELEKIRLRYAKSKNTYLVTVVNIFIKKYTAIYDNEDDANSQINYSSSVQKAAGFLGGDLAFETVIDGLSRFLVKRIKEELTTHAIEKIQKYLNNPSQKSYLNELMVLLPTTTDYLKNFEASQVLNFTDDFKQYIEKDLNNLLKNAGNLRNTPRFKALIERNPDVAFAFEAIDLIPQISKIKEPLDYFKIIENSKTLNGWAAKPADEIKYNIANSIKLTSLLAHSLLVIDGNKQKLVSLDFMSNYGSDDKFYLLYLGFLHQQNKKYFNVQFTKDGTTKVDLDFGELMETFTPDKIKTKRNAILFFKEHIINIISSTEKLQEAIASIKRANKDDDKVKITEVHNLVETLVEFSEEIATTADDIIKEGATLGLFKATEIDTTYIVNKTKPYFETAKKVNTIFLDLHHKNYTTAITSALEIVSNYTNKELSLAKLINIDNQLKSAGNLTLLKTFLVSEKIPGNEKKKNALKDLAVRVEKIMHDLNISASLNTVKAQFDKVLAALEANKNEDFKKELKKLKEDIKSKYEDVLKEYAQIKLTEVFINPINKFIDDKELDNTLKAKLKKQIKSFTENTFKSYLIGDDKGLKASKEDLVRYLTIYFPELSSGIFKVKDKNVLRIIHFITDIALSDSAEDVESALEAFALPAGSSSAKEKVKSYYSINSYPGILLGKEFTDNDNAEHIGITAPIGIYTQLWKGEKTTWGLFVPVIDIAAPVRFRFDGEKETETLPDFDFKDIFSPGAYISVGVNNSPFAINAGIQYGPKLRDIDNGSGVLTDIEAYRISVGVVIDIPLFTLFTSGIDD